MFVIINKNRDKIEIMKNRDILFSAYRLLLPLTKWCRHWDILNSSHIVHATKSIQKRLLCEHLGIVSVLDIVLNASRYLVANSKKKS